MATSVTPRAQTQTKPLSMMTSYICNYPCANIGRFPIMMVTYADTQGPIPVALIHGEVHNGETIRDNVTLSTTFRSGESLTFPFYIGGLSEGVYDLATVANLPNGTALSGVSTLDFQLLANGSVFIGQRSDWSLVGGPALTSIGTQRTVQTSYRNNLNFTVSGIVWLTIHNSMGQTVAYSTATLNLPANVTGASYNVVFGLPSGTYYATVFVTSVSFVAALDLASFNFTF